MTYDANLVLKNGLVALDENDVAATTIAANADGNHVVDLKKTGLTGLDAVLILPTQPTTYADTLTFAIQASNHLTDGWETIAQAPIIYAYMMEMMCTATTAFVSTDIGLVLTATTDTATGTLRYFDPALLAIGGYGRIIIEMNDAGDVYATAGDVLTATAGTGVGLQGAAAWHTPPGGVPGCFVVRFATDKRYVRSLTTVSAGGAYGLASIFLTDHSEDFPRRVGL